MSRLRIFDTDPEAKPKPRQSYENDLVGKFRSGKMSGRSPVALDAWRVTTGDPTVADAVAEMFGGDVAEWETSGEDSLEVLTDADAVRVIIDGPAAIQSDLKLWGANGVIIHHCDGVEFLDDERKGKPCGCPELLADRKAAAKAGHGPKPDTRIVFRIEAMRDAGKFRLSSGSWDLVRVLHEYENAIEEIGGSVAATLALETVSFVPKGGPMKGKEVSYKKPTLSNFVAYRATADDDEAPF